MHFLYLLAKLQKAESGGIITRAALLFGQRRASLASEHVERRLRAILAADVAGYSRLTGLDEEGTHARLEDHLHSLVDPKISEHRGRVVKNTGDGLLAEFSSVVEAVRCALDVQHAMAERNADVPPEKRIEFRIGINIGDIILDHGDIFGDGVNVAARLQDVAEPGGICLSEDAHRQVRGKLDVTFEDQGERQLKNVARPVQVFRVALDDARPEGPIRRAGRRHTWSTRIAAIGIATVMIAGAGGAALYFHLDRAPVVSQTLSELAKPRFSIVVLPFASLSADPSQDYLSDVIGTELTTGLSRIPGSFVISRSTAFTYRGKPIDVRQIGKDLGVRYVLEGSVQPSGDRLRVHAQLIDTESDVHLWAGRFDEDRSDLLQMQDDIVSRVARAIHLKMPAEMVRLAQTRVVNPNAEDFAWRCYGAFLRTGYVLLNDAGYSPCEQALQIDPENVRALSVLSYKFIYRFWTYASPDRQSDLRRAEELTSLAIKIDSDSYLAHMANADVLQAQGRNQEAIDAFRRATMLNPGLIPAGMPLAYNALGEPEQAIAFVDKAMRLSPRDPFSALTYGAKAIAYGILQDYQEALVWVRRAEAATSDGPYNGLYGLLRSGLLALSGQGADARTAMQRYLASSNAPIRTITQVVRRLPKTDSPRVLAWQQKYIEGLRKAGLPE
jgi:adenylate cyclase